MTRTRLLAIALVGCLGGAGCGKREDGRAEQQHPATAECTELELHFLALARKAAARFEGTADTPEEWAKRWGRKCRVARARFDVPCLMAVSAYDDVVKCPERVSLPVTIRSTTECEGIAVWFGARTDDPGSGEGTMISAPPRGVAQTLVLPLGSQIILGSKSGAAQPPPLEVTSSIGDILVQRSSDGGCALTTQPL
jgi:hypothetical protein